MQEDSKILRKKRRNGVRSILTWTLIILGSILILGIIAGTILDLAAFTYLDQYKDKIHHFIQAIFTSCIGLLCLILGLERSIDFDNIDITLEKQHETLTSQRKYFETSAETLEKVVQTIQESLTNSKILILKINELVSKINPPTVLKDIDWKLLIKQSDEIDFLVQGWDGWMVNHSTELEEFFKRSGRFKLFVINSQGDDAAYVRQLMGRRLEKSAQQVEVEITNTISNIQYIFDQSDDPLSQKALEVYCLNEVNWYFAAQFKSQDSRSRDALVLSFYSHHQYLLKETPAIILYRDSALSVFKWFDAELAKLKNQNRPT